MLSFDITDGGIKFVRGQQSGNKVKIYDADMRELTMGMVSNGYITDVPMVASELNDIIKSKNLKEKEAFVSITSSNVICKELVIPKPKSMKNTVLLETMVMNDMQTSSDYNVSFSISGEFEDEEHNKMLRVYATACPQRLVDGYVKLFSHVGLQLKQAMVSNNSACRLINNTPKIADKMPMLLVQIDNNFLNSNLYEGGHLVYSKFTNISASDIMMMDAPEGKRFEVDRVNNEAYEVDIALYNAGDPNARKKIDYTPIAVTREIDSMLQFYAGRRTGERIREILFYGDFERFIEISSAVSSFGITANMLPCPVTVSAGAEFDFAKYANAVGALFHSEKEKERTNLLEATSARESKGLGGFGLALGGVLLASAVVIGGVTFAFKGLKGGLDKEITKIDAEINDPAMKADLAIVSQRESMLAGFNNYNETVDKVIMQFNYQPKVQSLVFDKLLEPMDGKKGSILNENEQLEIESIALAGNEVEVSFKGLSKGNPTDLPSRYANYLTNKVLNQYGDPYFLNVVYSGYEKDNISEYGTFALLSAEEREKYDTYFSFEMTMNIQMGSDEEHTDIIKDLGLEEEEGKESEVVA